jgi:signal transduction histidine kinase/CheY-like chemotaxis protein
LGLILILVFSLIVLRIIAARLRTEEINLDQAILKARLEKTVKERTAELEVQTRLAKSASEAKGSFLANMSHEIRTPLNAVIGMTEIARRSTAIEKKDTSLEEIAAASDHLLGILNDVLDMSKIESGKFTLIYEPFELGAAMEEVAVIIHQRCEDKHIIFTPDFSLSNSTVMGDKLRLKQVLINLLGNAVKFTPENGTIRFLAEISGVDEKKFAVHFLVSDNGVGMKREQMDKLFRPFEQTDASIADRFGGTGLGLSISQNLVQLMGGLIRAASEPGRGSTFEFTLDLDIAPRDVSSPPPDAPLWQDFTGKRVLLTEDIEINRIIVRELLADTRIEFDDAVDGIQALELFYASPEGYYSLIFMDVQMPNMDGYEATRRIRALDRGDAKTVPIIAMTANAYREDIEKALEAGMNTHLAKPVNMKEVRNTLNRWLK